MARLLATGCLTALGVAVPVTSAQAQSNASQSATVHFDVPAGPLGAALERFTNESGYQLLYASDLVSGKSSPGLTGDYSVAAGLAHVLADSGLTFQMEGDRTIQILPTGGSGANGERVLGAVRVEGVQGSPYFGGAGRAAGVNGINGSSDITATEGTGSFTTGALTVGSKAPQAMKDVPQSLSVLTNERMEQQNVTDFTTAMKQLPGVTLVQGATSLENTFYSRGFPITSIQVDGGAPLATSPLNENAVSGFFPQIDMSIYDHVELLRGAAGLFNGYGDPGGAVNLVRKKPLDHAQLLLDAQAGSWSNYRVVADATSPLALNGRLRGRLVMTYQDNHHFYDVAKDNKTLIYGIAEFDVTPTTLLTAGANYTRQDSVPWQGGLPRYLNGDDLKLPRSTCLCFGWNRWDFDTTEIFGQLKQKIGDQWTAELNLTRNRQTSTEKVGYSSGAVNPTNGLGPQLNGIYYGFANRQLSAEATLFGAFTLFGQRQEVTIGANRVDSENGGGTFYSSLISTYPGPYQPYPGGPIYCLNYGQGCPAGSISSNPPINVFNFDPSNPLYTEPGNPLPASRYIHNGQIQSGAYINLRLTAFDRLHLTTGLRWSRFEYKSADEQLCTTVTGSCAGKQIGDVVSTGGISYSDDDVSWPPPINLSFDVTKALTAYAGYTDIYLSQANQLDAELNPLPPVTGSNWEGGLKWALRDGKLNLSLAAYRVRKKGIGTIPDFSNFHEVRPGIFCCWAVDPNSIYESKGIDFEATGELRRGLQISASYAYNNNEYKGRSFGSNQGRPFLTIAPKSLYKLWVNYDFGAAGQEGALSGLAISAGVNGQSSGYQSGYTCVRLSGMPDPVTGAQSCASYSDPDYVEYHFIVPSYALVSARIDYRLSNRWSLALNLDNILDKKYYQTTGGVTGGNWYGAPRSFTASLRAKW